jgi:HTH-type transcriptional regulator/antitoxin HigA
MRDSYFELVRDFPLRAIQTEADAVAAGDALTRLLMSKPEDRMDAGERAYMDAISVLIQDYQAKAKFAGLPKTSGIGVLKHLMAESGMKGIDLGQIIGSQPAASEILNGKRSLSKNHIMKLASYFKVSPALFLDVQ